MDTLLFLLIFSFLFGFFVDFSDLLDEHGLVWFRGAPLLTGIIWGVCGALLVYQNPEASIYVTSIVIYWVLKQKLDYLNHAVGGTLVLLASIFFFPNDLVSCIALFVAVIGQALQGFLGSYIKKKYTLSPFALNLIRLRHYVPAILTYLVFPSPTFLLCFFVTGLGLKISDIWFVRFEKTAKSKTGNILGLSIKSL